MRQHFSASMDAVFFKLSFEDKIQRAATREPTYPTLSSAKWVSMMRFGEEKGKVIELNIGFLSVKCLECFDGRFGVSLNDFSMVAPPQDL